MVKCDVCEKVNYFDKWKNNKKFQTELKLNFNTIKS